MNTQTEEIKAVEALQPAENTAKPEKKKRGLPAAIRAIFCFLLSVILAASIILTAVSAIVRVTVTEKNIDKLLDSTEYMTIPITVDNIQSNLYEIFFIAFANGSTEPVDIYRLAEETELKALIAEQLYDYAAFILYDERLEGIDSGIIKDFYDEHADQINKAFNVTSSKEEIYAVFEEQDEFFAKLTNNEIEASIPMIKLIRFAMSPAALIIFAVLAVVCIVIIGVLSRSVGTPLVITGISATATGLAGAVGSCLTIFGAIGIPSTPVTAASVIWQGASSALLPNVFTIFVYILTAGILLILTGGFIGQIRRNLRRAKNNG